jgi:4'-phosphopantetheinyl transferase
VAVALSDHPVGIDIETTGHYSAAVARRVMNDDEMREIVASAQPEVTFTRLWTMKESLYKLTGDDNDGDIAHLLDKTSRYRFTTTVHPRYLCTVCSLVQS